MKKVSNAPVRMILFSLALLIFAALPAYGQEGKLQIEHLNKLADRAAEVVDVTLDQSLLQLASKFMSSKRSPDEAKAKEMISDLKGVYVKRYVFEREGEFTSADVESIRSQLRAPGWMKIANVRSKRSGNDVDVLIMAEGSLIKGLAVLAVEPKALTIVNVIGPIDIEKLAQLEGQFGIPRLDIERDK